MRVTSTLIVLLVAWVIASRVAEPSVRPVLYATRPVVSTTTVPTTTVPTTTVPTTTVPTTTVPTTTVPTTTVPTTTVPIDEVAILSAAYRWGPSEASVILQQVLGVSADGWYGPATRTAHVVENQSRGLPLDGIPPVPTTTTTAPPPTTSVASVSEQGDGPTTTAAPPTTTAAPPTTTAAPPTTTAAPPTTTAAPPTTTAPPIMVNPTFGGMGAELVAQLLGQPCIADGDLSDCPPEVGLLVTGLVGG
ncbi:uncharacterized protein METZ01_LOCUS118591 [marine metagenome]|uniref:Peptidoglycan binding-like domain-containing protein n=1 Tax=marine metagenome TaxID=408172 RepID=A0A381XND6_9ZZZZ